jgi:drug/metabolite transporter (DMT)-like permease
MDILLPSSRRRPRTGRWTVLAVALLGPPLVCWAGLLHLMRPGGSPADLLLERLSPPAKIAALLVCPAIAAGIGFVLRRRAATQAAKALARVVAVCGAALVVLAVLAALRPS